MRVGDRRRRVRASHRRIASRGSRRRSAAGAAAARRARLRGAAASSHARELGGAPARRSAPDAATATRRCVAVGDDRGALRTDRVGQQVEQAGQARLGGRSQRPARRAAAPAGASPRGRAGRRRAGIADARSTNGRRRRRCVGRGDRLARRCGGSVMPDRWSSGAVRPGDIPRRTRAVGAEGTGPLRSDVASAARTGRPSVRRTTSMTSSTYWSASPRSAAVRTQPWTWSSSTRIDRASTAARSAAVCWRMSTQYSSRSIIRAMPRTWPSMRDSRRISWALSLA